jgi:predicted GH43/DUF377 family glycosyl hydrolase
MVKRIEEKVLVEPSQIPPSDESLEVIGTFNPGVARVGEDLYMMVRVAEWSVEKRPGFFSSPHRVRRDGRWVTEIDWFALPEGANDVRSYDIGGGRRRLSFISHLRLVKLDRTGFTVTSIEDSPTFCAEEDYEEFGIEDPRVTQIGDRYYMTYVVCSRTMGCCTALAETSDFKSFRRHGIIFPMENKDILILPEKVNDHYIAYHRPGGFYTFEYLSMAMARSGDLIHWGEHRHLLSPRPGFWDDRKLGGGCVPLRTDRGWLEIYHGVTMERDDDPIGIYCAGAALFDLSEPGRLIARSKGPIIFPDSSCEKEGFVPGVVFPTACIPDIDERFVLVFCGAADEKVEVIKLSLQDIFDSLESY